MYMVMKYIQIHVSSNASHSNLTYGYSTQNEGRLAGPNDTACFNFPVSIHIFFFFIIVPFSQHKATTPACKDNGYTNSLLQYINFMFPGLQHCASGLSLICILLISSLCLSFV